MAKSRGHFRMKKNMARVKMTLRGEKKESVITGVVKKSMTELSP